MSNITKKLKFVYLILLTTIAVAICASSVGFSAFTFIAFSSYLALILIFLSISGQWRFSVIIANCFIIILQLINQLKVHYYKERLFFPDIYIACDVENFGTLLHYPLGLLALLGLLFFIIISGYLFYCSKKIKIRTRFSCMFIALILFMANNYICKQKEYNDIWQTYLPKGRGTIVNLFMSSQEMSYVAPSYDADPDLFLNKAKPLFETIKTQETKPDVVIFLQESALDTRLFKFEQNELTKLAMFEENLTGKLRVQTHGGGTWLSEFSILTGLNSDDFSYRKNAVFYTVAPHIQTTLFKEFRNNGYETIVISPMGYGNYNAGPSYHNWGMDTFYHPADFGYPATKNNNIWDIPSLTLTNYVKKLLTEKRENPRLIYVLSMAEHGPYDSEYKDLLNLSSKLNDHKFIGRFNDYYPRLEKLDMATQELISYMNQTDQPTLLFYFGDHQPALSWQGEYDTTLSNPSYLTQFTLANNYSSDFTIGEVTDISLASGLIAEKAGIDLSDFYKANIAMRYLCDGKLDECEDKALVTSYKNYIYQQLGQAGK